MKWSSQPGARTATNASSTLAPERSIAALKVSSWRLMASGPFDLTGPRATTRPVTAGQTMSASQCSVISVPDGSRSVTASSMRHRSGWSRHARQPEAELGSVDEHIQLRPEGSRRKAGPFDKRAQLGPGKVGVDPAAEAAIRAGNDVLTADDCGVAQNAVGDERRVLDKVGSVADDARHQHFAGR